MADAHRTLIECNPSLNTPETRPDEDLTKDELLCKIAYEVLRDFYPAIPVITGTCPPPPKPVDPQIVLNAVLAGRNLALNDDDRDGIWFYVHERYQEHLFPWEGQKKLCDLLAKQPQQPSKPPVVEPPPLVPTPEKPPPSGNGSGGGAILLALGTVVAVLFFRARR
jgi:hypothetical protein